MNHGKILFFLLNVHIEQLNSEKSCNYGVNTLIKPPKMLIQSKNVIFAKNRSKIRLLEIKQ